MKKNWKLFNWAFNRIKWADKAPVKCFRNRFLFMLMRLSRVTPEDAQDLIEAATR